MYVVTHEQFQLFRQGQTIGGRSLAQNSSSLQYRRPSLRWPTNDPAVVQRWTARVPRVSLFLDEPGAKGARYIAVSSVPLCAAGTP